MSNDSILEQGKEVLQIEAAAISQLIKHLDENFVAAVELLYHSKGRAIIIGMGKPGIIARKLSATFASTGTPSFFLHSAEAAHGDLGMLTKDDVAVILSNSGETEEIIKILPSIKKLELKIISLTGNLSSTLAQNSDIVLNTKVEKEACKLGLAPTASTTAMLAMGDALAIVLLQKRGFKKEDYAFFHPGGALGKRLLLKVEDIMRQNEANPLVKENELIKDVLLKITQARAGAASVVNEEGILTGIFTDGDLRRHLKEDINLLEIEVGKIMTRNPIVIGKEKLVAECLKIFEQGKIDEIPVVDENNKPVGLLDIQDAIKAGIT